MISVEFRKKKFSISPYTTLGANVFCCNGCRRVCTTFECYYSLVAVHRTVESIVGVDKESHTPSTDGHYVDTARRI
jgi:hypothetical protein